MTFVMQGNPGDKQFKTGKLFNKKLVTCYYFANLCHIYTETYLCHHYVSEFILTFSAESNSLILQFTTI